MRHRSTCLFALIAASLSGCGPRWPNTHFPTEAAVARTLFAAENGGFRETCIAIVVELTDDGASRVIRIQPGAAGAEPIAPTGWKPTPVPDDPSARTFYEGAFGGCGDGSERPLGDLPGALTRPGAYYKVLNGGDGIAIMMPAAKLAGFFYFG